MSDQNVAAGDPNDPRPPCAICKSTDHTTGFHGSGVAPADGKPSDD